MLSTINKGLTVAQRSKQDSAVIVKPAFNPLTFDVANLLALYDGETLTIDPANTWTDQSANGYDLTLFNAPTIINNGLNGLDTLRFDGINQYGSNVGMIRAQPETIYIVFNQITWTGGDYIMNSQSNNLQSYQAVGTPNIYLDSGAFLLNNPGLAVNTYGILTYVFNGLNSELRNNNNAAVVGNGGAGGNNGIYLFTQLGISNYANAEVAYLIIRSAADNTATQNLFINWLKNRFAL